MHFAFADCSGYPGRESWPMDGNSAAVARMVPRSSRAPHVRRRQDIPVRFSRRDKRGGAGSCGVPRRYFAPCTMHWARLGIRDHAGGGLESWPRDPPVAHCSCPCADLLTCLPEPSAAAERPMKRAQAGLLSLRKCLVSARNPGRVRRNMVRRSRLRLAERRRS